MSSQFFERQETQRSHTRWLVVAFVAAFLLVTVVINLVVIVGLMGHPGRVLQEHLAVTLEEVETRRDESLQSRREQPIGVQREASLVT